MFNCHFTIGKYNWKTACKHGTVAVASSGLRHLVSLIIPPDLIQLALVGTIHLRVVAYSKETGAMNGHKVL